MKNPYKVLGVDVSATIIEIKKAFRRMSMKTHPDKGGSNEEFQEVKKAYEILATPKKRQQYDETGAVEDDTEVNQHINSEIASVFFATISKYNNKIKHLDIISEMIRVFETGIESAHKIQAELKVEITKYEEIEKRITNSSGEENIFKQFTTAEISKINQSIDNNNKTIERLELAKTIIETYKCEYEIEEVNESSFGRFYHTEQDSALQEYLRRSRERSAFDIK